MALAGLGCSALLPLTVSFAEREFALVRSVAVGRLIAFCQVDYGIAAIVAVLFAAAALVITRSPRRANRMSRTGPRS